MFRRMLIVSTMAVTFLAGAMTAAGQNKEAHPVLERAIEQINNIKGRLQQAPKDFGGHKQKAMEALTLATDELRLAIQSDRK